MSKNSAIYKSLIKLGIKKDKAKKISNEVVKKAKDNPMLSDKELNNEIEKLSEAISKLSKTTNKLSIDYGAIIYGVIATGVFELLVLLNAWLSSMFASTPSKEIEKMMQIKGALREHIDKKFSQDVSDSLVKYAIELETNKNNIINSIIIENNIILDSDEHKIIVEFIEHLIQIVEFKYIKELNLLEEANKTQEEEQV